MSDPAYENAEKALGSPAREASPALDVKAISHARDAEKGDIPSTSDLQLQRNDAFPCGKWKAWSTVIGAFLIQFYVVGILTGFGVFQEFYTTEWLPKYTTSDISWIGGVQYMFELGLGPVAGRLYDEGYGRLSTLIGSFISMFRYRQHNLLHAIQLTLNRDLTCSFFMLSIVQPNQYYQVFLVQGVGMGLGLMFVFGTTMTMVSQHFKTQRALAMGIVAASAPLGSIMYTILLNHLFHGSVGFAWGMRYVAFATLGCFVVGNLMLHSPIKGMRAAARQRRALKKIALKTDGADAAAATATEAPLWDAPFVLTMVSAFLWSLGATPPNFYMQLYAEMHGVNQQLCFYSFAILSFASIFGRILPGWMSDRWGAANVFIPSLFMVAVISFAMFGCGHPVGLVIFALVFGYFFGTVIAMYMPMVASMTPEGAGMGRRLGVSLTPVGVGSFVGPPMVGAILGPDYAWWKTIVFSGIMVMSACAFNVAALVIHRRRQASSANN
ncbi:major facilitator superfamily domain-containing protein [Schizophyllum fasciatum]